MNPKINKIQGINGSTLKIIAMITMLIDHIAAFLIIYASPIYNNGELPFEHAEQVYHVMRAIGRTAFPIFCFLLVEGFIHTHNVYLYLGRLMVFAVISEVPYDLAAFGKAVSWQHQNVFFTLALGMGMMMILDAVTKRAAGYYAETGNWKRAQSLYLLLAGAVLVLFICIANLIECDYGGNGIILIAVFYLLKKRRILSCVIGYLTFLWEPYCFPAFLVIPLYNGKRGFSLKYLFYFFYPVHLLVLYILRGILF